MDNKRIYTIQINGITESANAVDALNKQLDALDKRIKALENSNVKVSAGGRGNASALSEEEAIQREINKLKKEGETLDAKIAASQDEIYKRVDATKQLYKETIADQKAMAAQERLTADAYSNTMQGMKNHLADLKAAINVTDLGDSDKIKKMTQEANELTNKLKEMEQAYGQYGRNVGNYAEGVAEGLQKVKVNVGGTVREFANAREASRALSNELKTMAVNGEQDTKAFKDMQKAVAQLNSDIKDATVSSRAMDNLLDTIQSLTAIGQVGQGFSALFGFDDDQIQKSIQKLVALQNVMQGIEKLNQQMNSGEGIGGWLSKGNSMIDSFVAKITGAAKAQETLNTATKAGEVASKGLAAAEETQAVATNTATVATKGLSLALKALGIGLIISAVATLITYWEDIYDWFTDTIPALKNLEKWFEKIRAVAVGVGSAILNYMVQPLVTLVKVIKAVIDGNFSDIPKIIGEGMKKTFDVAGNYQKGYNKEVERQQKVHNNKMLKEQKKANNEWLADEEAKYGKSYENTKKYLNQQMALVTKQLANTRKGSKEYDALIQEQKDIQRKIWENERTEREKRQKKAEKDNKEYAKKEIEAENELSRLRIANMKEGLNKVLKQLEEERKQKIAKIRADGVMVKELEAEVNKLYDKKIVDEKKKWAEDMTKVYDDMWEKIYAMSLESTQKIANITSQGIEIGRHSIENDVTWRNQNISSYGIQGKNQLSKDTLFDLQIVSPNNNKIVEDYKKLFDLKRKAQVLDNEVRATQEKNTRELMALEEQYLKAKTIVEKQLEELERDRIFYSDEEYEKLHYQLSSALDKGLASIQNTDKLATMNLENIMNEFENAAKAAKDFEEQLNQTYTSQEDILAASVIQQRLTEESYSKDISTLYKQRSFAIEAYWQKRITFETSAATANYDAQVALENERYEKEKRDAQNQSEDIAKIYQKAYELEQITLEQHSEIMRRNAKEFDRRYEAIEEEHTNNLIKLEKDRNDKIKQVNGEAYRTRLQELRDFQTAIANLEAKQPVFNSWGIINTAETRKNNENLLDSYRTLANKIVELKQQLQAQLNRNEISFDDFQQANRELDTFAENVGQKMDNVKSELKSINEIGAFIQSIEQYVQAGLQAIQTVMNAFDDYQDYQFDKEQDTLDKENEMLEDMLDKQQDILEKHKSAVESIEDELATSRGDRRQHLIDQLNAEMEAERAAAAEKKRLEKEQEKLQAKQDALDKKRKEAEYKRNLLSIIVSTAMATANGLATQPFVPVGIAMGALATTLGMVQYALAAKAKPYAHGGQLDGGVAQGPRHSQGGIKVLGGRAEIEGGEFITNRRSTASNIDLLEFINSKKAKVDLGDLLEFYNGNTIKKNIRSVRTKFEDGGYMPTLPNQLDIKEQLQNIVVNQDNRPIYVSVVDINNKQDDVRRVQTLAGL